MNKSLFHTRWFFIIPFIVALCLSCMPETLLAPVTIAPENGATVQNNPPQFIWRSVENADFYWLQVSHSQNFTDLVIDVSCTADTVYTPTTSFSPGAYFWRVLGQEGG